MPWIIGSVKQRLQQVYATAGLESVRHTPYDRHMAVDPDSLSLVIYPDEVLKRVAQPVDAITEEVVLVAQRMLRIMHDAPGVGLAAPQVGLNWRMFVANPTREPIDDRIFINPIITPVGRQVEEQEEGCLSLPNITAKIRRPKTVSIKALGIDGQPFELQDDDLAARVWQHETDHLDGVLILDRMSKLDKLANRRAVAELEQTKK